MKSQILWKTPVYRSVINELTIIAALLVILAIWTLADRAMKNEPITIRHGAGVLVLGAIAAAIVMESRSERSVETDRRSIFAISKRPFLLETRRSFVLDDVADIVCRSDGDHYHTITVKLLDGTAHVIAGSYDHVGIAQGCKLLHEVLENARSEERERK